MAQKQNGAGCGWIMAVLIAALAVVIFFVARPGEEGRVLRDLSYEADDEQVCAAGPGSLVFGGEPEEGRLSVLTSAVRFNASREKATLSEWQSVTVLGDIPAQEAVWTREGKRFLVRLVGPNRIDDDATVCLFEQS